MEENQKELNKNLESLQNINNILNDKNSNSEKINED